MRDIVSHKENKVKKNAKKHLWIYLRLTICYLYVNIEKVLSCFRLERDFYFALHFEIIAIHIDAFMVLLCTQYTNRNYIVLNGMAM